MAETTTVGSAASSVPNPMPDEPARYRVWPAVTRPTSAWVIHRHDLRVERLTGLHQALASGALEAAAALVDAAPAGLGLFDESAQARCAVRLARDRLLLVSPEPLAAAPGWHSAGFALTWVDDGLQIYALDGVAVPALLRSGTAIDPAATSPCASLLLGGFAAIAYRCQGRLRLHVERALAPAFEAWVVQAAADLPPDAAAAPA